MFRPVRSAISVAILAAMLWAAFAVELGDKTFAEHVDTISETPEAKQLINDTRATVNPALVEVRDRVLGEYVEAPTWIADDAGSYASGANGPTNGPTSSDESGGSMFEFSPPRANEPRMSREASGGEPPLPGRR